MMKGMNMDKNYGLKPGKYDFFVDLYARDYPDGPQFKDWTNREGFSYEEGVKRAECYIIHNRYLARNDKKRAAYILQDFKPENLNVALDCLENEELANFFRKVSPRDYYLDCWAEKMQANRELNYMLERGLI